MFITFEGGEGCGKSTHAKRLKDFLDKEGFNVILTREPGGSLVGDDIRKILIAPRKSLADCAEIFLFAADRIQHVEEIIEPALREGKIVLCDRFIDSTVAYQIGGRGLPEDLVRYINMISSKGLIPNFTFLLDVPVKIGLKRAVGVGSPDRFEASESSFHERVRAKYLEIAKECPERITILNTEEDIDIVSEKIRKKVLELLKK